MEAWNLTALSLFNDYNILPSLTLTLTITPQALSGLMTNY